MAYNRSRGAIVCADGYYVGAKGSETKVIDSTGKVVSGVKVPISAALGSASSAQTVYVISPVAGTVKAVYVANDTASRSAAFSVTHGSAGDVLASITTTTAASVAGNVETMTLGTVAVTAGESIGVARGTQGSTGSSVVTLVIERTS